MLGSDTDKHFKSKKHNLEGKARGNLKEIP